jgi:hypothetical protein
MAWTAGVTTGATMATEFNAVETGFTTLDADFDALVASLNGTIDGRIAIADIADLADVTITAPADGHVLTYQSGVWVNQAPSGGGGSPGGSSGELQYNNAGVFAGVADVEVENGKLRLIGTATPAAPAAGGLNVFSKLFGAAQLPAIRLPAEEAFTLAPMLGERSGAWWKAGGNGLTDTQSGMSAVGLGTSTAVNWATTSYRTERTWREFRITVASTTAVCGFRDNAGRYTIGGAAARRGGFLMSWVWSPGTGVTNASHRAFVGMHTGGVVPTDVNPSTLLNCVGMGYDSADTNVQMMHNDGAGACTKIDLGGAFPKPNADQTKAYLIQLYAPSGTTQAVHYRVVDLDTLAEVTGTINTNIPATSAALSPHAYMSVGGVSSVIGIGVDALSMWRLN